MNGRMYDANLGLFLSPDNYIQDPFNTQNYNRYGYVLNNPLSIVDPSGESFLLAIVIGAIIGGSAGGALANGSLNPFGWTWDSGTWTAIIGGSYYWRFRGVVLIVMDSSQEYCFQQELVKEQQYLLQHLK